MAELKTKPTDLKVSEFLGEIPEEQRRNDCLAIVRLMQEVTGAEPIMWGNIVGFGDYHYKYASGREGDWFLIGFSPRKQNLSLYLSLENQETLLQQLGKHKRSKYCLYIDRIADIDLSILKQLLEGTVAQLTASQV